ncbi:MAG: hypothetical protein ACK5XN_17310 [Bacteroidota bacterium]
MEIEQQFITAKIQQVEGTIDSKKLKEALEQIKLAEKDLAKQEDALRKIQEKRDEAQKKIYVQNMYNGVQGSQAAAWQFKYEHAMIEKKLDQAKKYKKIFDDYKAKEIAGKDKLKGLNAEVDKLARETQKIEASKTAAEKALKALVGDKERLQLALSSTEKTPVWFLRNSPFIDFLDPTIKIRQYVITNATNDMYFQQIPKIDRCTTCHVFIDKPGYEDQQNPYKTHPKVDTLAVGVNSAHPVKDFGCTSCHGCVGDRVNDFNSQSNIPQN